MTRLLLGLLMLLSTSTEAAPRYAHPSLVGCSSDGQLGPLPPPKSRLAPSLPTKLARALSFYSSEYGPSVLAPRGWHCFGLYGSNGSLLVVTPEAHRGAEFFRDQPASIRGPAVQSSFSEGETSGRFAVAEAIDRYFPIAAAFARSVHAEDSDTAQAPTKRHAAHIILGRTNRQVRILTPAGKFGAGTDSRLIAGRLPIQTQLILMGSAQSPSLLAVHTRLPVGLEWLTGTILSHPGDSK